MKRNYSFRLLLATLLMAFAGSAAAAIVTFDFSTNGTAYGGNQDGAAVTEFSEGLVTVTVGKGSGEDETSQPQQSKMFADMFRFYKYGILTLSVQGDHRITTVQFTAVKGYKASDLLVQESHLGEDGTWTGNASSVTFTNTTQVRLAKIVVVLDGEAVPEEDTKEVRLPYQNGLLTDNGDFAMDDKTIPQELTYIWKFDNRYGAVASAYNQAAYTSESWLVSPIIDLTGESGVTFTFEHTGNQFESLDAAKQAVSLLIKPTDATQWTELPITNWFSHSKSAEGKLDWTFVQNTIDLTNYVDKKIQIAFRYTSTTNNCGKWEVRNFSVAGLGFVATPTFEPEAGQYLESVTVTLEAQDGCSIYYSLDGSTPSIPYQGSITLTETTTITAFAQNEDGDESETVTATYTIIKAKEGQPSRFDFAANEWNLPVSTNAQGDGATGNIVAPITNSDGVILEVDLNETTNTPARLWKKDYIDLRIYNGQSVILKAPAGQKIAQVFFYANQKAQIDMTAEDDQVVKGIKAAEPEATRAKVPTLTTSKYNGIYTPAAAVESVRLTANATNTFTEIEVILEGNAISWDVNGDGTVDVGDVTALVGIVLGGTATSPDLNGDGAVDVGDVTALVQYILSH